MTVLGTEPTYRRKLAMSALLHQATVSEAGAHQENPPYLRTLFRNAEDPNWFG
jgi:hypothetical protein